MDENRKVKFWGRFRGLIDRVLLRLPLPNIDPNLVSSLSVLFSLLFLIFLKRSRWVSFAFLVAALAADGLDGLIAKKYGLASHEGYLIDVYCDRLSEGLLFLPFLFPWFALFGLNCLLAMASFRIRTHVVLPLRMVFLPVFFFWHVI